MGPGAARTQESGSPERAGAWRERPRLASAVRAVLAVGPTVASAAGSVLAAFLLPRPSPGLPVVFWWIAVLVAGGASYLLVRRLVVRFAPLAALLDLALIFPGEAPSRYKLARRARSADEALAVLERLDEHAEVQAAAEASLALVLALEEHDAGTRGHSERVRLFADLIGAELGISREQRIQLRWSALLHDLGKLRVHQDILNKPGRPSAAEWEALKRHPLEGARLVRPLRPWLGDWVDSVAEHHERYDGKGYPSGAAGEDLSLGGRIVAVADSYETMTARRAYKQPRTAESARAELVACAGAQFDPAIVRAFLAVSLPRPSRRTVLAGWLASLPLLGLVGRLPRQATATTAAASVSALAVVVAGLLPVDHLARPRPDVRPPAVVAEEGARDEPGPVSAPEVRSITETAQAVAPRVPGDGTRTPPVAPTPQPDEDPGPAPPKPEQPTQEPPPAQQVDHVLSEALTLEADLPGQDTTWDAQMPLTASSPEHTGPMPNYDRDRDDLPGLTLRSVDARPMSDLGGVPAWTTQATSESGPVLVGGDLVLTVQLALPRTSTIRQGVLDVDLLDCSTALDDCERVVEARLVTMIGADGSTAWQEERIRLGSVAHVLRTERALALTITASDSAVDVLLGFGTSRVDSRLDGLTVAPANVLALSRPGSSPRREASQTPAGATRWPEVRPSHPRRSGVDEPRGRRSWRHQPRP